MQVYLDNNRATMLDQQVIDAMMPMYSENYAIADNKNAQQLQTKKAIDEAFEKIRASIHARNDDKFATFTSADDAHIRLLLEIYMNKILTGQKNSIILSATESDAIYETAKYLADQGCRINIVPLNNEGIIDIDMLRDIITPKTALVSITMVDSMSGAIMPIDEVAQICKEHEVPLHSDATHAIGKLPIDVQMLDLDYMSISTETMHGPSDIALMYIKDGMQLPNLITPIHSRAGLIGIGKALELAADAQAFEMEDVRELRDELEEAIREIDEHIIITSWAYRVPNTIMAGFKGVHSEALIWELAKAGISVYSERSKGALVDNLEIDPAYRHTLVGFALSRYTTEDEIKYLIEKLPKAIKLIREERIK